MTEDLTSRIRNYLENPPDNYTRGIFSKQIPNQELSFGEYLLKVLEKEGMIGFGKLALIGHFPLGDFRKSLIETIALDYQLPSDNETNLESSVVACIETENELGRETIQTLIKSYQTIVDYMEANDAVPTGREPTYPLALRFVRFALRASLIFDRQYDSEMSTSPGAAYVVQQNEKQIIPWLFGEIKGEYHKLERNQILKLRML